MTYNSGERERERESDTVSSCYEKLPCCPDDIRENQPMAEPLDVSREMTHLRETPRGKDVQSGAKRTYVF